MVKNMKSFSITLKTNDCGVLLNNGPLFLEQKLQLLLECQKQQKRKEIVLKLQKYQSYIKKIFSILFHTVNQIFIFASILFLLQTTTQASFRGGCGGIDMFAGSFFIYSKMC